MSKQPAPFQPGRIQQGHFQLRPYQQQAVDATLSHFRQTDEPAVIVLPTGAGKSLVIAELARLARRRILVLAHVKELVEQNHHKYESYGHRASIFAAGLNRKEADTQVIFGSVQSVVRNLSAFDDDFSLLIIDECHRVSTEDDSEYQQIISHLSQHNPRLKVLGLTATPYRLGSGWIYHNHLQQQCVRPGEKENRAFASCIFELPLRHMVDNGYLTPATLLDAPVALYDFEQLRPAGHTGEHQHYSQDELNRVVLGAKRATAKIIDQLIDLSKDRQGVMIFAATVAHAKEIITYLPPENSALIIGDMKAKARDSVIAAFKDRQIKFLVNVSVLTTGFDAPHVDVIAILRPTQSVSLYQQIVGRGLRLSPGKTDCLVLDYAGNTHSLYRPEIGEPRPDADSEVVTVPCPLCNHQNQFWGKVDDDGDIIEHYGRRCQGLSADHEYSEEETKSQHKRQCDYRFRFKECSQCGAENDIAARQCHQCGNQLVDPDQKLKAALQLRDAKVLRCSGMSLSLKSETREQASAKSYSKNTTKSRAKKPSLVVTYHDEDGAELKEYFSLETPAQQGSFYHQFLKYHQKDRSKGFYPKSAADVIKHQHLLRAPDFVIARKKDRFWVIRDKVFDYEGQYRRANELG